MLHLGKSESQKKKHRKSAERGFRSPNWRGGEIIQDGRVFLWNGHGYTQRARVVMENKLGRLLRDDESVHHINHNTLDDSPKNLEVMSTTDHAVLSNQEQDKASHMRKFRWKKE